MGFGNDLTGKQKRLLTDGCELLIYKKMQQIDKSIEQAGGHDRIRYIKERIEDIDAILELQKEFLLIE